MKYRFLLLAPMLVLATAFAVAGGGQEPEPVQSEQPTDVSTEPDPDDERLAIDEQTANLLFSLGISPFANRIPSEDFVLPVLDGAETSLEDHRGKLVLLNFWATWCPPCREEMPSMQILYDELADQGLEILAVDVLETEDLVRDYVNQFGFTYKILLDRQGRVAARYAVRAFPTTYIIDRDLNVIGVRVGYHDWSTAEMIDGFRFLLEQ